MSEATFYIHNSKKKFGGLGRWQLRLLRQLKDECNRLKRLVAYQSLNKAMLQDVLAKKALKPSRRRVLVDDLMKRYGVNVTKACAVVMISPSLYREQGLSLRHKRPKRNRSGQRRQHKAVSQAINDIWSMDFVMDQLFDGRRLRALTLFDNNTRACQSRAVQPYLVMHRTFLQGGTVRLETRWLNQL